jgi:hypothetical protein
VGSHPGHPDNAHYLEPLDDPELEDDAQFMADINHAVLASEMPDDTTEAQFDYLFEQCQIDARRMLIDDDFYRSLGICCGECPTGRCRERLGSRRHT